MVSPHSSRPRVFGGGVVCDGAELEADHNALAAKRELLQEMKAKIKQLSLEIYKPQPETKGIQNLRMFHKGQLLLISKTDACHSKHRCEPSILNSAFDHNGTHRLKLEAGTAASEHHRRLVEKREVTKATRAEADGITEEATKIAEFNSGPILFQFQMLSCAVHQFSRRDMAMFQVETVP